MASPSLFVPENGEREINLLKDVAKGWGPGLTTRVEPCQFHVTCVCVPRNMRACVLRTAPQRMEKKMSFEVEDGQLYAIIYPKKR